MPRFSNRLRQALLPAVATNEALPGSTWQRSFSEVEALACRSADERISYGDSDQQFIDLWLPQDEYEPVAPIVILIHGGCWLEQYDIAHIRPLATAIADNGFAVWAIEYRRLGQAGGGWPGTFTDIAAAVDKLEAYSHLRLDRKRVVLAGHSAGGQLALWAAGRSRLLSGQVLHRDRPFMPRGAVGLAAITDLAAYARGDNDCQASTPTLMGGWAGEVPERYAQASPAELGTDIPVVLIQGIADTIVPPEQAAAMPAAEQLMFEMAGHFDLIHTGTPVFPKLIEVLQRLVTP